MKKICFLLALFFAASCYHAEKAKKPATVRIPAGANVPSLGLAVDVSYDPKTDNVIPGYKIISVAITNNSVDIMNLDRETDKWAVEDFKGKTHLAVTDLRSSDPKTYISLPERLRHLIQYPLLIQVGETKIADLLVKNNAILDGFKSVRFSSKVTGKSLEIVATD